MMHSLDMFTEIDDLSTACHDMVNVNILAQLRVSLRTLKTLQRDFVLYKKLYIRILQK